MLLHLLMIMMMAGRMMMITMALRGEKDDTTHFLFSQEMTHYDKWDEAMG